MKMFCKNFLKYIKSYTAFNEEHNLKKATLGGAMIAGMALGNPSVGQTVGGDLDQTDIEQQDVKGITTITLTETNFAQNATINIDVPSGNNLKIQETATGTCYVYTTNWDLLGQCPWQSNKLYNDTTFWVTNQTSTVTINVSVPGGTGVEEIGAVSYFSVYPNPAREVLYIVSETNAVAHVLDVAGRVVIETEEKMIDIRQLKAGVYFLVFKGNSVQFVKE